MSYNWVIETLAGILEDVENDDTVLSGPFAAVIEDWKENHDLPLMVCDGIKNPPVNVQVRAVSSIQNQQLKFLHREKNNLFDEETGVLRWAIAIEIVLTLRSSVFMMMWGCVDLWKIEDL